MSIDRSRPHQSISAVPDAAAPETPPCDGPVAEAFAESDRAEDTVPYIPPLASYRIQGRWGEVRRGVPTVFPEDAAEFEE